MREDIDFRSRKRSQQVVNATFACLSSYINSDLMLPNHNTEAALYDLQIHLDDKAIDQFFERMNFQEKNFLSLSDRDVQVIVSCETSK